jgi:hypothetical protein
MAGGKMNNHKFKWTMNEELNTYLASVYEVKDEQMLIAIESQE